MENQENSNKNIAYKKAEKRVKEIKTYYYMVLGFLIVGYLIVRKNYNGNIFDISRNYAVWMVITWAIFLIGYGIYLFVPYFNNWEERKTKQLMDKQLKNK
ncbi:MAG: hypothetical protein RIR56_427 [Bacteroidota bacterium]|jgi:hypothetical protein|nr:2TM domain-containing protein [Cloacibacterium sp.]MBP8084956.1 2TM domain-containing protein [Cloacibacterium sp.]